MEYFSQLGKDDDETTEEDPDNEEDEIENILEDEFPKDEEDFNEEEEEQESEAIEHLRIELGEKFELDMSNMQMIQVNILFSFSIIQKVLFENFLKDNILADLFNIAK